MIDCFHFFRRFRCNSDMEVSFRPAVIALAAARVMNNLNAVGYDGHIPKHGFQASDAVGVHRGHIRGVHIIAACYLDREYRQHLYPIGGLSVNGDGIIEESREIIPLMESMIGQIEEQQTLMAEMLLEMQNRDTQLSLMQEQNQKLQKLNSELSELLNILPNTEELLSKMEEQKTKIELLENENQQWQILAQKLNSENSLLLKQNTELLNWNSR